MGDVTKHVLTRAARLPPFGVMLALLVIELHGSVSFAQMPNIVYILADDMGLGDVRSYTANSPVNTPNIDRIANAGMRFTDAHSSSSVCTPSRYSILTGRYTWRTNVLWAGVALPYASPVIEPSRLTVAEMLKTKGYNTGAFGKWHLGAKWQLTSGTVAASNGSNVNHNLPISGAALDNGFDTYFGVDAVNYPPYAFIQDNQVLGNPTGNVAGNPTSSANSFGPIAPGYSIPDTLVAISTAATNYISQKANQPNPFFMYYPLTAPHEPVFPPAFANGQSGVVGAKKAYGDFIWTVDWAVGQVLDTLKDPNHDGNTSDSVLDNTIVVFAADNGAAGSLAFATSSGNINGVPMRGTKATLYEGGHRVPFVVQWNGHVQAGTANDDYVELTDFMATVANVVDYSLPSGAAEDSFNILPELTGNGTASVRSTGINHSYWGAFAIRQTDEAGNQWKMLFTNGTGGLEDGPSNKFSPTNVITDFTKVQLYNLKSDPAESTNLLAGGGTLAMRQKALQLQGMLQDQILANRSKDIPAKTGVNGTSTILIDFGDASRQTSGAGWNNIAGAIDADPVLSTVGMSGMGLYDSGGGYSGIVIKTAWTTASSDTGVASLANSYSGPYPTSLSGLPSTALSDGFFVRDGNKLTISLESLDAHAIYDLEFYAAASSGPTYSLFTVTGNSTQQVSIAPLVNNSTQTAMVTGITPDSLNRITIDLEGRQANGLPEDPGIDNDGSGWLNFMRVVEHLLELPGDFNNDRIVDSADYYVWRRAFGTTGMHAADGNHDGVVDGNDYVIWRKAMMASVGGSGSSDGQLTAAVPEPTGTILLAVATTNLVLYSSGGCRISRPKRRATLRIYQLD